MYKRQDQDIAPLLIGEWGGHMDGAENQKWMELLRDYMIDNHINHTFWCLNPNSGDTGGLLSYDFMTWDEEKYGLFEKSLWQTNVSGKYIGPVSYTHLSGKINKIYVFQSIKVYSGGLSRHRANSCKVFSVKYLIYKSGFPYVRSAGKGYFYAFARRYLRKGSV